MWKFRSWFCRWALAGHWWGDEVLLIEWPPKFGSQCRVCKNYGVRLANAWELAQADMLRCYLASHKRPISSVA